MIWIGRADETTALGLLLDRTYADVAAAAERPRLLDREFLIGQFDLWDAHLLPAVAAGTGAPWTRRSAARAVWRRLGSVAGTGHRRWMAEHLAGLGLDPAAVLGSERDDRRPSGGPDQRPMPVERPMTAESAALIRSDYDLDGGAVTGARMEVGGADPSRIDGLLRLTAAAPLPELHFRCRDATVATVPYAERGSMRLTGRPVVTTTEDEVSLVVPATDGTELRLSGRDLVWHRGHEHEPATARATVEDADVLGALQLSIMRQLRRMRRAELLRRWELAAAGLLCAGLNAELFRPRPAALRTRWAARRLRALLDIENNQARAFLRQVGRDLPLEVPELPRAAPPAPARITVGTAGRLLDEVDFTGARLRLVDVSADHRPGHPDQGVIHLDARRGGRDTIVVIALTEPLGRAPLTVTPGRLTLTRRPTLAATADDIALTIPLPDGDWTVRAAAGSWYVD
jgi:hypothetical protein